ncbi:MAG: flagellar motor switch protein FliM [Peptococcaceae bacterium]|nr:flagellar motor switch protein FliM [Peptococcaceae bacterium]
MLSQDEIDNLLSTVSTGALSIEDIREQQPAEKEYKSYDFRRPNKFSKDHLRRLHTIHDNFARIISGFASAYLNANIQIHVDTIDQLTFEEFTRSVPTPTVLTVFSVKPLKGLAVLETNAYFMFPVIDLLLGGKGTMPEELRELTDIELAVIKKMNTKMLDHLRLVWRDVYEINPQVTSLETNPRLQQVISPNEIVALITFTVNIEDTYQGMLNLCFPYNVLEPVLSNLTSTRTYGMEIGEEDAQVVKQRLQHWVEMAEVDLSVVLGETEITVGEFLQLQVGDIIPLERRYNQDLDLLVEEELKYKVQAGILGRFLAVQVTGLVEAVDDNG